MRAALLATALGAGALAYPIARSGHPSALNEEARASHRDLAEVACERFCHKHDAGAHCLRDCLHVWAASMPYEEGTKGAANGCPSGHEITAVAECKNAMVLMGERCRDAGDCKAGTVGKYMWGASGTHYHAGVMAWCSHDGYTPTFNSCANAPSGSGKCAQTRAHWAKHVPICKNPQKAARWAEFLESID